MKLPLTLVLLLNAATFAQAGGKKRNYCSNVDCKVMESCAAKEVAYVPHGIENCCYGCRPLKEQPWMERSKCQKETQKKACDLTLECDKDEILMVPRGQCCPTCMPKKKFLKREERRKCRITECPEVDCPGETFIPEGECCKQCKPVEGQPCNEDECPQLRCEPGFVETEIEGECCPSCLPKEEEEEDPCAKQAEECPPIRCALGFISTIVEGDCCPSCQEKKCTEKKACPEVLCKPDHVPFTPEGECCPTSCKPKDPCDGKECPHIKCPFGSYVPEGECCETCKQEEPCSKDIMCPQIACEHGSFMEEGKCCPTCKKPETPDCSLVLCKSCQPDEIPLVVENECCPKCEPKEEQDCSLVKCAQTVCDERYYDLVKDGCCGGTCELKPNCQIVQCVKEPCPPVCAEEDECPQLDCKPGYEARKAEGDRCPTCQLIIIEDPEPCYDFGCLDPCHDMEGNPVCKEGQECVTETIYQSGGGPHCPKIGCPQFVECKGDPQVEEPPVELEPEPCMMMACLDPCHDMEGNPVCKEGQECVMETIYQSGGGPHCPDTGCPHFIECKGDPQVEEQTVEPEPCYDYVCLDPCHDYETDGPTCKEGQECVTKTILRSGGGPHCPEIGCAEFVECKGDPQVEEPPVELEPEPCMMMACLDPCHDMEGNPVCKEAQECVMETIYQSGGGPHCPDTGCPHFVECKGDPQVEEQTVEPEPCYDYVCLDPCHDYETDGPTCKEGQECVTKTILRSGGGPHCPEIGCAEFVECKGDPQVEESPVELEPEPCVIADCMDPCYNYETDSPTCKEGQECVTETIYQSGGGPHCPDIGCAEFVECKD